MSPIIFFSWLWLLFKFSKFLSKKFRAYLEWLFTWLISIIHDFELSEKQFKKFWKFGLGLIIAIFVFLEVLLNPLGHGVSGTSSRNAHQMLDFRPGRSIEIVAPRKSVEFPTYISPFKNPQSIQNPNLKNPYFLNRKETDAEIKVSSDIGKVTTKVGYRVSNNVNRVNRLGNRFAKKFVILFEEFNSTPRKISKVKS